MNAIKTLHRRIRRKLLTIKDVLARRMRPRNREARFSDLFHAYKPSLVFIEIELPSGDVSGATSFHIGRGYLVTARHVVDGNKIRRLVSHHYTGPADIKVGRIYLPADPRIDLAILETNFSLTHYMTKTTIVGREHLKTDHIPLGGHLDDWLGDEFTLSKALLMGYPPVPRSKDLVLVAIAAEVNAVVDKYDGPHPHFIISAIPRGGFSGAPVISEYGFLLGVMTESLVKEGRAEEVGFAAVVSIQPLLDLVDDAGIDTGKNTEFMKRLFSGDWNDV